MNKRLLGYLSIGLYFILISLILFIKITSTPYLYNYDPWDHSYYTYHGESKNFFSRTIETNSGMLELPYKTFLRSEIYLLSLISDLDIFFMYQFGSIFLRIIFVIAFFILLNQFTNNKKISAITCLLIFSSYYFVWRSYITFPENLAIIFHMLTLWSLEKYRISKWRYYLYLLSLLLIGVVYIHPTSFYYSIFILMPYIFLFIFNKKEYSIKNLIIPGLLFILLLIPISTDLILILSDTITNNIGDNSDFGSIVAGTDRYRIPNINDYIYYLGTLLFSLSLLGVIFIIKNLKTNYFPIIILFLFSLFLSLGPMFKIYVPIDRMQAYLFIPIVLVVSIYLVYLKNKFNNKYLKLLFILILYLMVLISFVNVSPWFALWRGEIEIAEKANSLIKEDSILLIKEDSFRVIPLIEKPSVICVEEDSCKNASFIISKNVTGYSKYNLHQEKEYYLLIRNETAT